MPAIHTNRLRVQMAQLMALQYQPAEFAHALHQILEIYNDYAYHAGQTAQNQTFLPHYQIPHPVTRQIDSELTHLSLENPQTALILADALWHEPYYEARQFAIHILSQVPVFTPEPVLERITSWAKPDEDKQVLRILITQGAKHLICDQPDKWSDLTQSWLINNDPAIQSIGLYALYGTVEDMHFQNLPAVYRLISPMVQEVPEILKNDLLLVLQALAKRSPGETAYFFHQVLTLTNSRQLPQLIRPCLAYFPSEIQASLRQALRSDRT